MKASDKRKSLRHVEQEDIEEAVSEEEKVSLFSKLLSKLDLY